MNHNVLTETVLGACFKALRPLIRILLRHGIGFNAFSDIAKRLYIDVARSEFALLGKKQTASRLSTMTGLSRKEVTRVCGLPVYEKLQPGAQVNRSARVLSGWVTDKNFQDDSGRPLDLSFEDDGPSFSGLVKQYSGDITARTIADELMRVGAIAVTVGGRIRLLEHAYIPRADALQQLQLLGIDVSDLIETFDHNMRGGEPYFQRKVQYSHVAADNLQAIREELAGQAQHCLEHFQKAIVERALGDTGPRGRRIGIGIYYFENESE